MNKNFLKLSALIALSSIMLSGCATIFSGSTQNIKVQVLDSKTSALLQDVNCTFTNQKMQAFPVFGNPGSVQVQKGGGTLSVNCKKDGYKQADVKVGDSFNAVAIANILFWPGLIVDGMSGAYKKYPSHYKIIMEKI